MTSTDTPRRRLISLPKAAEYLDLSPRTLRSLVASKTVHYVRVSPGRIAFDITDLDAYVERQRQ